MIINVPVEQNCGIQMKRLIITRSKILGAERIREKFGKYWAGKVYKRLSEKISENTRRGALFGHPLNADLETVETGTWQVIKW